MKVIAAIALGLGLAIAMAVTFNYYVPFLPMCSSGQCQRTFTAAGSHFFGVPISALGVVFWILQVGLLANPRAGASKSQFALTLAGFTGTVWLLAYSHLELKTLCFFCAWHAVTVFVFAFASFKGELKDGRFWRTPTVSVATLLFLSGFAFAGRNFLFNTRPEPIAITSADFGQLANRMQWNEGDTLIFSNPNCGGCKPILKHVSTMTTKGVDTIQVLTVPLSRKAEKREMLVRAGYSAKELAQSRDAFLALGLKETPTIIRVTNGMPLRLSVLQFVWEATIQK